MQELNLSVDQFEEHIAAAFEHHLIVSGQLTLQQARDAEYSFAIPQIQVEPDHPPVEERKRRFRTFVVDQLHFRLYQSRELLQEKVCRDAEYGKNKSGEGLTIIVGTLDGILSAIVGYPIPAVTTVAWLVKTRWLDKLCQCPPA